MNGDGLPDRLVKNGGALQVYLNTGSNFANTPESWGGDSAAPGIRSTSKRGDDGRLVEHDLMDINGDGLPDRVSKGQNEDDGSGGEIYSLEVRLNSGSGFGPAETWTLPDEPVRALSKRPRDPIRSDGHHRRRCARPSGETGGAGHCDYRLSRQALGQIRHPHQAG